MQFGIMVPTFSWPNLDYDTAAKIKQFAQRAEALDFDALWVCEHLLTAPGLYGSAWLVASEIVPHFRSDQMPR